MPDATLKPLRGTDVERVRADLYDALDATWNKTQDVARKAGYEWSPGASVNAKARDALFWLHLHADAEHMPLHNGHVWRRPIDSSPLVAGLRVRDNEGDTGTVREVTEDGFVLVDGDAFAARRANALYEAVQWAENEAFRLAEVLDAMAAEASQYDPPEARELRKRRTAARRLHRRLFAMLEATEHAYHANGGLDVPDQANPSDGDFGPARD